VRLIVFLMSVLVLTGCELAPRIRVQGEEFKVDIYRTDVDHSSVIKEEVEKSGICQNGYEIISTEYFMFGCPVLGFLPGDCRGTSYMGKCKDVPNNL